MQIFAFTQCNDFHSLLEVECKEITGVRPVIHNSVEELKNILSIFQVIDILIVDFPDSSERVEELKDFLLKNTSRINMALILGQHHSSSGNTKHYTRMDIMDLFDDLRSYCSPSEDAQKNGWMAIPVSTLIHFESVPFDLYIRLSDTRYVKRIHAHEGIGQEMIASLKEKGIGEMFCEKKYKRDFSMMLINNMINKIDRPYDSFMEQLSAQNEVFSTTKEIIQNLGLSGRVVEVCDSTIDRMCLEVLQEADQFSAYLLKMKNDNNLAFHFKLVSLTSYIGTQLIIDMKLSQIEEQVKKFVFASFFCDMTLKNPALHYHRRIEDISALSSDEQSELNFHALRASELVATYRDTPKEVGLIVRQHHGSFSGIGFPLEKSSQLLPLSKVLIISQDLAFSILTNEDAPVLETLKGFLKKHKTSALNDLVEILECSFREKLQTA